MRGGIYAERVSVRAVEVGNRFMNLAREAGYDPAQQYDEVEAEVNYLVVEQANAMKFTVKAPLQIVIICQERLIIHHRAGFEPSGLIPIGIASS